MNKYFKVISKTVSEILNISIKKINRNSKATDFKNWDSINQINIILQLEKKFKKKVPPSKFSELKDFKSLLFFFGNK